MSETTWGASDETSLKSKGHDSNKALLVTLKISFLVDKTLENFLNQ